MNIKLQTNEPLNATVTNGLAGMFVNGVSLSASLSSKADLTALQNYYAKTETSSASEISTALENACSKVYFDNRISGVTGSDDLSVVRLSAAEYAQMLEDGECLSNAVYIVEAPNIDAFRQQIKNVAPGTDLSDAVNVEQLNAVSATVPTKVSQLQNDSGYTTNTGTITGITMNGASKGTSGNVNLGTVLTAHQSLTGYVPASRTVAGQQLTANVTAATISSAIGLGGYYTKTDLTSSSGVLKDYSLTSHTHSQYLTAVPSTYKTYNDTKSSLSSDGYATQTQLDTKSAVSVDNEHADANILHISQEEYNQLVVDDATLSNTVYVISSDCIEAYGQQIKNVAPGTDLSDAVNVEQLNAVSATVPTKVSQLQNDSGYTTNTGTITGVTMNGASKGTSGNVDLGTVLTAVPPTYKTYAGTISSLSSDGYATQAQLGTKSSVSVDSELADVNILHISQEEYNQLVVDDATLSNTVYVISSDCIEAYGQQIKNVAPGTDLSDAVNVEQLQNAISSALSGLEGVLHEINTGSQS